MPDPTPLDDVQTDVIEPVPAEPTDAPAPAPAEPSGGSLVDRAKARAARLARRYWKALVAAGGGGASAAGAVIIAGPGAFSDLETWALAIGGAFLTGAAVAFSKANAPA